MPNGTPAEGKIIIEPAVSTNCYTDRTKDVYLALTQIYYMRGMPDNSFMTSIAEIARYMGVPNKGKWFNLITEELDRLYKTTLTWKLSYHTDKEHPTTVNNQHILSTYNYHRMDERIDSHDKFEQTCEIDFDIKIKQNLRQKKSIPMNLTSRLSISSPIQRVLFDMVDTFLANQPYFELSGLKLVKELNLGDRYKYLNKRKVLVD